MVKADAGAPKEWSLRGRANEMPYTLTFSTSVTNYLEHPIATTGFPWQLAIPSLNESSASIADNLQSTCSFPSFCNDLWQQSIMMKHVTEPGHCDSTNNCVCTSKTLSSVPLVQLGRLIRGSQMKFLHGRFPLCSRWIGFPGAGGNFLH